MTIAIPRLNKLCTHIILLALLMTALQFFQSEWLFQRTEIQQGEIWRILTGNLVHTNYYHLLMNMSGLAFVCLLFKDYLPLDIYYFSLFITLLAVGLGIYFFSTHLIWYAGLSGSLYGLYMVAAATAFKAGDYFTSLPILIGIPAKLLWDSFHTELTDSSAELIGAPVATDAHLYGIIAGIIIAGAVLLGHKKTR